MARSTVSRSFFFILILAAAAGAVVLGMAAFRTGDPPEISIEPRLPGIGKRTPVHVVVEEPGRGLTGVRVEFVQGERVTVLAENRHEPLPPWGLWGHRIVSDEMTVDVGSETVDGLREGEGTIRVVAERAPSLLRRPDPRVEELQLEVRLRPPTLEVTSIHNYVAQGGCEVVVYRVGESSARDGVRAGDWWFPGYPLPGGDALDRFALFAVPYDLDDRDRVKLVAEDALFNVASRDFIDRFTRKPFSTDRINLSDRFMARVVPAILEMTPDLEDQGDLLANYLMVNGDLRTRNAETLVRLAQKSAPEFLWNRPFLQMRNAQVMSEFADRRTYLYDGEPVDRQDHLGFDLASTRRAEIQAANAGIVLMAGYFGIYGNAVLIDHGYGLMSLYGHLSEVQVAEGESVERGRVIGRSGVSGLAAGDHLHYTTLLQGLPVNPREWWDGHWIEDRMKLKLEDAFPFER